MFEITLNTELLVGVSDLVGQMLIIVKIRKVCGTVLTPDAVLFSSGASNATVSEVLEVFLQRGEGFTLGTFECDARSLLKVGRECCFATRKAVCVTICVK